MARHRTEVPRPEGRRDVAEVLQGALSVAGWTLEELGAAIEVPSQHLRLVLRGEWPMSGRIAARSAYVLAAEDLAQDLLVAQALAEAAAGWQEVHDAVREYRAQQGEEPGGRDTIP